MLALWLLLGLGSHLQSDNILLGLLLLGGLFLCFNFFEIVVGLADLLLRLGEQFLVRGILRIFELDFGHELQFGVGFQIHGKGRNGLLLGEIELFLLSPFDVVDGAESAWAPGTLCEIACYSCPTIPAPILSKQ